MAVAETLGGALRRGALAALLAAVALPSGGAAPDGRTSPARPEPTPEVAPATRLGGYDGAVLDLIVSPAGGDPPERLVAALAADGSVRTWRVATAAERHTYRVEGARPTALAFAPERPDTLAVGWDDGAVRLYAVEDGRGLAVLAGAAPVEALAFAPGRRALAVGAADGTVRLWDPALARPLRTLGGHARPVRRLAFSTDGTLLASGDWDGRVRVWDAERWRPLFTAEQGKPVLALAFSPIGAVLATGSWDGVALWHTVDGQPLRRLPHPPGAFGLAFPFGDTRLVSVDAAGGTRTWSGATGELLQARPGAAASDLAALSADGARVATGSLAAGPVRVWRLPGL